ncbi:MAG: diadenylate cyclase [Deltaproteobacteria bacterium]|nr:diadenylate cyclase [Deltaproteobacteria bacterium]
MEKFEAKFFSMALKLGRMENINYILYVTENLGIVRRNSIKRLKEKLILASTQTERLNNLTMKGFKCVSLPPFVFSRQELVKIAMASAITSGFLKPGHKVLCIVSRKANELVDSVILRSVGEGIDENVSYEFLKNTNIPAQLMEIMLELAVQIGFQGYEGINIGTIFVIGDTDNVMAKSKQIVLNPFQGYSEQDRNLYNPEFRQAIRAFTMLDGAFVVREDGVVLSAGRYLETSDIDIKVPLGLGSRHSAAAAITKMTQSVAIVVSETSGAVRIFKDGQMHLEIQSKNRLI